MKIGIVTFHRAHNYGALLQAFALRLKLTQLGHEVYFVDYWPEYHASEYKLFNSHAFYRLSTLRKLKYIIKQMLSYSRKKRRYDIFNSFIDQYILPYTKAYEDGELEYDAIIYGSDQIWRRMPEIDNEFDPFYFAENELKTGKHIAYAASMGILCDSEEDKAFLSCHLAKFSDIGVREADLLGLVRECGFSNSHMSIDPTLLIDNLVWTEKLGIKKTSQVPYALFYDLMPGSFDFNAIAKFVKDKGLRLRVLKGRANSDKYGVETIEEAGPKEFVSLIANAELVFTSSFHGLAFSIIYKKPFFASYKHNSARASSLLGCLNLSERLLEPMIEAIPDIEMPSYDIIGKSLLIQQEKSFYSLSSL